MHKQRSYTSFELTIIVLIAVLALGGWIANIVKLVGMDFGAITGLLIVRVIGISIVPLGAVMGFI